jgi:elongation factor Ts
MANYTTADVKKLRELTAAGMMDCKKALDEADGDFDKAVEILRIKGAKDVGKRAERTTSNGLVAVKDGAMIELRCETDFVAKNADFIALAEDIVALAKANKVGDVEALKAVDVDGKSVDALVQEFSAKIGEKLELAKAVDFDGTVSVYLHKRAADLPPAVGVLVEYTGDNAEVAKGAAMQIAAMRPKYVTRDEVPEELVANERRIAEETAREEGKPEGALPKIVEGRVNGFFKENVLLEQPFAKDAKKTVTKVLEEAGAKVTSFARFRVGS